MAESTAYAGSGLMLTCAISFPAVIDGSIAVYASWTTPFGSEGNSSRAIIFEATPVNAQLYHSILTIPILNLTEDSGDYTCNVTVSPLSDYSIGSAGLLTTAVTVIGRFIFDSHVRTMQACINV